MADTQDLITDLKIKDNLSVGLANAKKANDEFGASVARTDRALLATEANLAKTSASFTRLGNSVANSIKAFVGLGAAFKVGEFFGDAIKNAQEDEASVARLTAALHANVEAWDGNTVAIEKAIGAGAKLGFTDDEIRSSLTRLSAATHDLGQSITLQNTAMDLARFKNVDLATATDALVTIEAGRFRGLAQLGIELKAGTTQTQALAAVQAVAAGSAKAFGETSAGAAKEAGIAMSEAAEAIGKGLLPVITDLSHFAKDDLAPALTIVGENMDKIVPVAEALAVVFGVKMTIGLVKSTAAFVTNTAALIANAIASQGAGGAAELLAANEVTAAAGATSLGTAAGAAATGGVAALLTGLKVIATQAAASGAAFSAALDISHQLARERAEANFATRDYADALQRLNDLVAFGSITQEEANAIQLKVSATMGGVTGALNTATTSYLASERAALSSAVAYEKVADVAGTVSVAQIAAAQATIDAGHAHDALAAAQTAAAAAAEGDTGAAILLAAAQTADKIATDALKVAQDAVTATLITGKSEAKHLADEIFGLRTELSAAALTANLADAELSKLLRNRGEVPRLIGDIPQGTTTGTPGAGVIAQLQAIQTFVDSQKTKQDKALADAKTGASAYADVLSGKLNAALTKEKTLTDTLFDALHQRHLQAIADTEKLAEAQHSTALQAISDALRLKLEANAAPVNAAEEAQRRIELTRQRRGLNESLQSALASADPTAIRNAKEALQSFNADQRIAALKLTQSKLDLAAQVEAAAKNKEADDKLAAAKTAQADAITAETKRTKQRDDFDRALAALKIRDKGASPEKFNKDLDALNAKFGITIDEQGLHHIGDTLAAAIQKVKIEPRIVLNPTLNLTIAKVEAKAEKASPPLLVSLPETAPPRQDFSPITSKLDDVIAAIKGIDLGPILLLPQVKAPPDQAPAKEPPSAPVMDVAATLKLRALADAETAVGAASLIAADGLTTFVKSLDPFANLRAPEPVVPPVVPIPIPPVPIEAPPLPLAAKVTKDDLSPTIAAIGDAAALATPKLAAFAETLGPLTLLKPREAAQETLQPVARQPAVQDVLEIAIKNFKPPAVQLTNVVNVYVPAQTLNGRLIAAAMASSQSFTATPAVRTGALSPRP